MFLGGTPEWVHVSAHHGLPEQSEKNKQTNQQTRMSQVWEDEKHKSKSHNLVEYRKYQFSEVDPTVIPHF